LKNARKLASTGGVLGDVETSGGAGELHWESSTSRWFFEGKLPPTYMGVS